MSVTVHVASFNTAAATELTIRTMRRTAGAPFELVVGDGGSTDGSLPMLRRFADRGWLTLEEVPDGRRHADWLDRWYATCPTRFAVFSDSDVEYRRRGWLAEMLKAAEGAAIVTPGLLSRDFPVYSHPVRVATSAYRLAPRPQPWLILLDLDQLRPKVSASFRYDEERVEGAKVAYDVGARFYQAATAEGMRCAELGAGFSGAFRHFGGLSWKRPGNRAMTTRLRGRQAIKVAIVRSKLAVERVRRHG